MSLDVTVEHAAPCGCGECAHARTLASIGPEKLAELRERYAGPSASPALEAKGPTAPKFGVRCGRGAGRTSTMLNCAATALANGHRVVVVMAQPSMRPVAKERIASVIKGPDRDAALERLVVVDSVASAERVIRGTNAVAYLDHFAIHDLLCNVLGTANVVGGVE